MSTYCPNCGAPRIERSACGYCKVPFPDDQGGHRDLAVPGLPADITRALEAGNKIEAIRLHMVHFKTNLRQAKDAIDAIAPRRRR
jgi:hypothetical protein